MFKTHCYRLLRSLFWFYIENLGVYHESRLLTPKLGVSDRVRLHVVFVRTVRYYLQGSLHNIEGRDRFRESLKQNRQKPAAVLVFYLPYQ